MKIPREVLSMYAESAACIQDNYLRQIGSRPGVPRRETKESKRRERIEERESEGGREFRGQGQRSFRPRSLGHVRQTHFFFHPRYGSQI